MGATSIINIAMCSLSFVWSLLVMALTGNFIASGGSSAMINYDLFCSVFGMLCLFFLLPASIKEAWAMHPIIPLVLNILNTIFWFVGGVATAAYLNVHSCSNSDYYNSNNVAGGSEKKCREAQASTAFLWFGFASFLASTVITGLNTRGGANTRAGGIRRGPAMSQV
ncbi:hypothetical protein KC332_g12013 [Hortaea werneckii]|uniref:MARVEL domain-containing protein n=2 Tax=Hortaea werneckii TaxID=91943 RepID=A0A3M7GS84_HORWE|nr:hypothetical protein KC350_g13072 [Hortaea werneckii]OTA23240.1 hypothetical protein BTJ68_13170 [Hortaea werneckii EXF-2000]KAI6829468.1 hypothetical protein KC358_g6971 [Hortaea werneckii]KAI6921164.1 hypothetical protein KC348_g10231 [Hortaea werneckii]KAI6931105.1 hypothetical protein KC341_g9807 [Hortaea werneckii]